MNHQKTKENHCGKKKVRIMGTKMDSLVFRYERASTATTEYCKVWYKNGEGDIKTKKKRSGRDEGGTNLTN